MKRILLATILGAVIFFIWSAIVHMNPVTGPMGLSVLNEKEDAVMAVLDQNIHQPGLYFFPGMDMSKRMDKEVQDAWAAKYKAGPAGLLLIQPRGGDPTVMTKQLAIQFVTNLFCALLVAVALTSTVGSLSRRAAIAGAFGLFSWLAISLPQWNWYEFPFAFAGLEAVNEIIGWQLAGFLMAKLIKPASQPVSIPAAATP